MEETLAIIVIVTITIYILEKNLFRILYQKYENEYGVRILGKSFITRSDILKIPANEKEKISLTKLYKLFKALKLIRIILLIVVFILGIINTIINYK